MAGYRRENKIIHLAWEEGELKGLEVKVKSVSVGTMRRMLSLASHAQKQEMTAEDLKALDELFSSFIERVIWWNLEHEEVQTVDVASGHISETTWMPTPITVAGLDQHDSDFVMMLIMQWLNGVTGKVDDASPLDESLSDGKPLVAQSLTMDPL